MLILNITINILVIKNVGLIRKLKKHQLSYVSSYVNVSYTLGFFCEIYGMKN